MSFDIFFQRFEAGEPTEGEDGPVRLVLEPHITGRDASWARIVTADGEADVYGMDGLGSDLMVSHASGRAVWDLMFELAVVGRFAVILPGCGTCITDASHASDLHPDVPDPVTVVGSGADLLRVVETS